MMIMNNEYNQSSFYEPSNDVNLDIVEHLLEDCGITDEEMILCNVHYNDFVECQCCGAIRPRSTFRFHMLVAHHTPTLFIISQANQQKLFSTSKNSSQVNTNFFMSKSTSI
mmetsp:Transcript_12623/g.18003  ORF Transcript_12623/g.18003 Transcript_12623/m.18003 type:complete len:111 (-) Transcript_12623:743-1075(-)